MKITELEVIPFLVPENSFGRGPGLSDGVMSETRVVQTLTKVSTDEGAEGY